MGIDMEVSKSTQKILAKQGLKFMLNTKVTNAVNNGTSVSVTVEDKNGQKTVSSIGFRKVKGLGESWFWWDIYHVPNGSSGFNLKLKSELSLGLEISPK